MDTRLRKRIARYCLAFITVVTTAACFRTVYVARNVSLGITTLPWNDVTSKSIDIQIELATTFFQIALLIMAALWALVIAKKDETRIGFSQGPELLMFLCSTIVLILSFVSYGYYINNIANYFADISVANTRGKIPLAVPDIFSQNINDLFRWQIWGLAAGTCNSAITLFSAHRLKE